MNIDGYKVETRPITVSEYQKLRNTTNWQLLEDQKVAKALNQDLFSVVVVFEQDIVAMGRVIGDGAIYFYIQDIIVHPSHRGQGVGKLIMEAIESFLSATIQDYGFIGLMAAEGVETFYTSFGYTKRRDGSPGMYKIMGS
ncbi:GNAT family N-acetyltransferase [Flagellimonas sp. 2504JD4-2]